MADLDPVLDQGFLEGEGAADGEADQVVAPDVAHVGRFGDHLAIAPDAVERQVGTDVEVLAQRRESGRSGFGHRKHRAGLRVGLGEAEEIMRQVFWQDDQVGLHIARREARGRAGIAAGADPQALHGAHIADVVVHRRPSWYVGPRL